MAEISNGTLALLVLVALAVVVTTTTLQLSGGPTGMVTTSDTGTVDLAIASSLQIEVTQGTINFGVCTPNATTPYTISTNASYTGGECDAAALTSAQRIRVANIGNVDANVSVRAECSNADFIPESTPGQAFFNVSVYPEVAGDCTGGALGDWTQLETSYLTVCNRFRNSTGAFLMPARVTIPPDAQPTEGAATCGADTTNDITFLAEDSPS